MFLVLYKKTAYAMRISDWSSDVCSSDLDDSLRARQLRGQEQHFALRRGHVDRRQALCAIVCESGGKRVVSAQQFAGDIIVDGLPPLSHHFRPLRPREFR